MSKFITRIELHGADSNDYIKLHTAMLKAHFYQYITSDNGIIYKLPTAEYYSFGEISAEQVKQNAIYAASSVGKGVWILVIEYLNAVWTLQSL